MAFYSKRSKIYHTNTKCPVGKAVKKRNRILGTGGRKMCNFCKTAGKGKMAKTAWRVLVVRSADTMTLPPRRTGRKDKDKERKKST